MRRCPDNSPRFDKVVEIKSGPTSDPPPAATLAEIEEFVKRTVRDVPPSDRQELQENLHTRLIADAIDDIANDQVVQFTLKIPVSRSQ
jgi:hypothetical protein